MTILSIDTATDHGSLAIFKDGQLLVGRPMDPVDGYSELLFSNLQEVLKEQRLGFAEIGVFAAASGPGSFTGVRVALATVKALAEATGVGALGISNLQAMASFGTEPLRAVLINARRGECYAAVYDADLQVLSAEMVGDPGVWLASIGESDYQFIAQDEEWLDGLLTGGRFQHAPRLIAPRHLATAVGRCAEIALSRGQSIDPVALDANYVRRSDVQQYWHDR